MFDRHRRIGLVLASSAESMSSRSAAAAVEGGEASSAASLATSAEEERRLASEGLLLQDKLKAAIQELILQNVDENDERLSELVELQKSCVDELDLIKQEIAEMLATSSISEASRQTSHLIEETLLLSVSCSQRLKDINLQLDAVEKKS